MAEKVPVEQIVERAVAQAFESQMPQLREKLVHQVLEEVRPFLEGGSGSGAGDLLRAVSAIHAGSTQKEILRALLEGTEDYSGRAALFVVKSGSATGWQGRAFDAGGIKDFVLDVTSSASAKVLGDRTAVKASVSEMDPKFISQFGAPVEDQILLLPLHLKDKVAALVYADTGTDAGGKLDASALELLVAAASAWLEVASLRKQAAKEATNEATASEKIESAVPVAPPAPSFPTRSLATLQNILNRLLWKRNQSRLPRLHLRPPLLPWPLLLLRLPTLLRKCRSPTPTYIARLSASPAC